MSAAKERARYRRMIKKYGRADITLRRISGGTTTEALNCRGRVASYAANQLVGDIQQGDQFVILLAEDLEREGWPDLPKAGPRPDFLVFDGKACAIQEVDANARNPWGIGAGVAIAYELRIRG